ncbi:hypothetical protein ANO11243_097260 [Dothideomycetidae sp. 11243]|nr:hypothetical protein ANO11243_097260 [fungal sp. No.11243]
MHGQQDEAVQAHASRGDGGGKDTAEGCVNMSDAASWHMTVEADYHAWATDESPSTVDVNILSRTPYYYQWHREDGGGIDCTLAA